jgi:small subunit ribosomal protein S8
MERVNREPVITYIQRVSKPGLRAYTNTKNIPKVLGNLGIAIISTSQGLMTDHQAKSLKIGGEILCKVY